MRPGARRALLWTAAALVLAGVFTAYLDPDLAVSIATQVWNCF
jgi:hypothetical protein